MTITRKQLTGNGWPLRAVDDMMTALTELSGQGWTGAVTFDNGQWQLRLSCDGKNTVNAVLGEWLVQDIDLRTMTITDFDTDYSSDPVTFPTSEKAPEVEEEFEEEFGAVSTPDVSTRVR